MVGSSVMLEDLGGKQFGGKLLWIGPYSLIVERQSAKVVYWKHALRSIRLANGKAEELANTRIPQPPSPTAL